MRILISLFLISCLQATSRQSIAVKEPTYIIIDTKTVENFEAHSQIDLEVVHDQNGLSVVELKKGLADKISQFVHEHEKRCGGYSTHFSFEEAVDKIDFFESSGNIETLLVEMDIDQNALVNSLIPLISTSHLTGFIQKLSQFYTRYFRSNTGVESSEWILKEWRSITKHRNDVEVGLFHHAWSQPSVYAKIKGNSDDLIIIGAHLDSKNTTNSTGRSPGADDDASGVAVISEVMKVLMDGNYVPDHSILFLGYSAEEDGLLGSQDIAKYTFNINDNILGVLQIDMAMHNTVNNDIYVMTDAQFTNSAQNNFIMNLVQTYTDVGVQTDTCGYGCSDHAAWIHPSLGPLGSIPFEGDFSTGRNFDIHTVNDIFDHPGNDINHTLNFVKLALAYVVEMDR